MKLLSDELRDEIKTYPLPFKNRTEMIQYSKKVIMHKPRTIVEWVLLTAMKFMLRFGGF